jgi:hypothetical protein
MVLEGGYPCQDFLTVQTFLQHPTGEASQAGQFEKTLA